MPAEGPGLLRGRDLGHVLTSPALVVTQAATAGVAGADHRAVVATVSDAGG